MNLAQFEEISLTVGISGLVLLAFFVLYKLSKENDAGPYGALLIFMTLGMGIMGFVIKSVIELVIDV